MRGSADDVGMILSGSDVVRRNLPVAFRQVYGEFLALRSSAHDQEPHGGAASLFNFAALLEWFIGRPRNAVTLCQLQMAHHAPFLKSECDVQRLACFVQAWTNVERLRLRSGQHAEVHADIVSLLEWNGARPIQIGPAAVSCGDWRRFLEAGSQKARVFSFCFVEGLKSFELAGDFLGALAFIDRYDAWAPAGRAAIEEARIFVRGKLGQLREALRHALQCAETRAAASAPLFRLHAAGLHRRLGQPARAAKMLVDLCPAMTDHATRHPSPASMRQIVAAARLALALGLRDVADELARSGWAGARRMGDEVFAIETASLLRLLGAGEEAKHWDAVCEQIRRETLYTQVATDRVEKGCPPGTSRQPHEGRLFDELVSAISSPVNGGPS